MISAAPERVRTLHELLLRRRVELESELNAAREARHERVVGSEHEVHDRKDEAAEHFETELTDAQEARGLGELARVDAALQRLRDGGYGECIDCGASIAVDRLLAQPAALRCTACETAHETSHRSGVQQV